MFDLVLNEKKTSTLQKYKQSGVNIKLSESKIKISTK